MTGGARPLRLREIGVDGMGKTFGYIRISSADQNEDRQLAAMREAAVPAGGGIRTGRGHTAAPCGWIGWDYFFSSGRLAAAMDWPTRRNFSSGSSALRPAAASGYSSFRTF